MYGIFWEATFFGAECEHYEKHLLSNSDDLSLSLAAVSLATHQSFTLPCLHNVSR